MSATEEKKIRFQTAMMKAAVQIVCKEKGLDTPKDIDKLVEFIVLEKDFDYGYRHIYRKDDLPCIISDFLGEAVWAIKKTENDDDGTAKLLVKIKDNVWQVDFKDFCKNGAADLSVEKLEKCEDEINYEKEPCDEEKNRIENILKDFEDYKKRKEQEVENMKKGNNMEQASTQISKNLQPQTQAKKRCSFFDFLFGWWTDRSLVRTKTDHGGIWHEQVTKRYETFHACNNNPTLRPDYPYKSLAK